MMSAFEGPSLGGFVKGALLGATFGAIVWIPALIATLVAFGLPIAWAQKRATQGLAREERGELVIGLVSATHDGISVEPDSEDRFTVQSTSRNLTCLGASASLTSLKSNAIELEVLLK